MSLDLDPPIHSKVLNSFTWDVWFSLFNSNILNVHILLSLSNVSFFDILTFMIFYIQNINHNDRKLTKLITWITALSNSMKLWSMPYRAIQDGRAMVESSDKMWSPGERNGKPLQHFCLENPMKNTKGQKDMTPEYELPQISSHPVCYWRRADK